MTNRGKSKHRSVKKDGNNLNISEKIAKILIENMTVRHTRILNDFKDDKEHKQPCSCWLCRFRVYEEMRLIGAPYDYKSFLAYDIFDEAMSPFSDPVNKISFKRLVNKMTREVIGQLPFLWPETKKELNEYARDLYKKRFSAYAKKGRYQTDKFIKLNEEITFRIYKENPRKTIKAIDFRKDTPASLTLKVAKFIYSQPDHKATEREIYRKFNKKKSDIVSLRPWLKIRFGITVPKHEKWESALYLGKKKSRQLFD
jgi:hypothetical protein